MLVATIGGLCLGIAFRRAFPSPVKDYAKRTTLDLKDEEIANSL
jgi:hypothetical protein